VRSVRSAFRSLSTCESAPRSARETLPLQAEQQPPRAFVSLVPANDRVEAAARGVSLDALRIEQLQQHRARVAPLLHSCCDTHLAVAGGFPAQRGSRVLGPRRLRRCRCRPTSCGTRAEQVACSVGRGSRRSAKGGVRIDDRSSSSASPWRWMRPPTSIRRSCCSSAGAAGSEMPVGPASLRGGRSAQAPDLVMAWTRCSASVRRCPGRSSRTEQKLLALADCALLAAQTRRSTGLLPSTGPGAMQVLDRWPGTWRISLCIFAGNDKPMLILAAD
jgi:hypothetical protein